MGEFGETRKGQNLETIISKLSKEQPNGRRNSFMLISGIEHSNVMFHLGTGSGQDSDGEDSDPDLFQCGKCKQMFTSLQKYLKHKAAKDCSVQLQGNRTVISPVTNGESLDSLDDSNSVHSPTKRKHDRKGIARRVSNFSSEGESVSPDIPVVVPEQTYRVSSPAFPVHIETPPTSNYHDFSNPVVSISVAEALRSQSPVVVHPTGQPNFNMWNGTVTEQQSNASTNPPTMATSTYTPLPQSTPVVNPSPVSAMSLHHPGQSSEGSTLSSPTVNSQFNGPRLRGIPVDVQPVASHHHVHMTRSKNGLGQPPPLVVHLKDRGRPVRAKETGLTEEELTDEIITSSGQKVFRCKKCDKEFSFSSRLKRHLLVHTGARPFECHVCLRRFTQAVDLKRHMLRHSGQKPHVCHFCGKQYTRGDRLKVHLLQHTQEDNSEKPYSCSRCSASFFEAEQLRLHVCEFQDGTQHVVVKPGDPSDVISFGDDGGEIKSERSGKTYSCDECNASFTKYTSLKSHLLKHTGEKKYRCEHCNKTFFSSSSLKIHVRVHTGDRPFKCKECPRKFSDPSNFNKHKRWHAKQKASNTVAATFSSISENSSSSEDKRRAADAAQNASGVAGEGTIVEESAVGIKEGEEADTGGVAKEADLREDLFPEAGQDMEVEETGGFKSPEALLSMTAVSEGGIKQEVETD